MSRIGCYILLRQIARNTRHILINRRFWLSNVTTSAEECNILICVTPFGKLVIEGNYLMMYDKGRWHLEICFTRHQIYIKWNGPRIRINQRADGSYYMENYYGLHQPVTDNIPSVRTMNTLYTYFWIVWRTLYKRHL